MTDLGYDYYHPSERARFQIYWGVHGRLMSPCRGAVNRALGWEAPSQADRLDRALNYDFLRRLLVIQMLTQVDAHLRDRTWDRPRRRACFDLLGEGRWDA